MTGDASLPAAHRSVHSGGGHRASHPRHHPGLGDGAPGAGLYRRWDPFMGQAGRFPRDTLAAPLEVVHVHRHSRLEISEDLQAIVIVRRGLGEKRLTPDDEGASDGIDRLDLSIEGISGISQHGRGECADQEFGYDGVRKEFDGGWTSNDGSRRIAWNAPQRS